MSHILQKVAPIGESRDKELLKMASSYVYASRECGDLHAHVFFPPGAEQPLRPAIIFFHGGFWDATAPTQFVPHCHHFASRGAVSITIEYRVSSLGNTGPLEALEDAHDALKWLLDNAEILNVDPQNIIISGASGGAYLGLVLAMRKNSPTAPLRPKAMVFFSSLVNTTPKGLLSERFPSAKIAKQYSPSNLVRRKLPPMLFLHGKSDRVTPFEEVSSFCRRMKWRRNPCQLLDFIEAEHSFFNFNVSHRDFEITIRAVDQYLVEQGVLEPSTEDDFPI